MRRLVLIATSCMFAFWSRAAPAHASTPPDAPASEDESGADDVPSATEAAAATTADPPRGVDQSPRESASTDMRTEIPNLRYAYTAYGARPGTFGVQAFGAGLAATRQRAVLGGGVEAWGAPIDRLTILGSAERNLFGDFAPAVAVVGRLLGTPGDGWSLGALAKFKVDGFAGGPTRDEIESEVETGILLSYSSGWHLDLNAIGGAGTGDDGEVDVEGRLRMGRDLGRFFRLGLDGQARLRVAGPRYLPNKQNYDWTAGPQLLGVAGRFFGSLTGGPSTVGLLSDHVGWSGFVAIGGTTL